MEIHLAPALSILCSNEIDREEASYIESRFKEILGLLFGDRKTDLYCNEISLFSKAIYFLSCYFIAKNTIGNDFMNLCLCVESPHSLEDVWFRFLGFPGRSSTYSNFNVSNICKFVAFTFLLEYYSVMNSDKLGLGHWKESILAWLNMHCQENNMLSVIRNIVYALKCSSSQWSAQGLKTWILDWYLCNFLSDGRYPHAALELAGLRSRVISPEFKKISLPRVAVLSWLFRLQLGIGGVLALKKFLFVFFDCYDDVRKRSLSPNNNSLIKGVEKEEANTESMVSSIEEALDSFQTRNEDISHQCMICRDVWSRPACLPCGHIACWSCWMNYRATLSSTTSSFSLACPSCRSSFHSSQIRFLFGSF